ncbi:Serine/threonine-protein kinase smg1, partial [Cymbomonas tetramitiformis]
RWDHPQYRTLTSSCDAYIQLKDDLSFVAAAQGPLISERTCMAVSAAVPRGPAWIPGFAAAAGRRYMEAAIKAAPRLPRVWYDFGTWWFGRAELPEGDAALTPPQVQAAAQAAIGYARYLHQLHSHAGGGPGGNEEAAAAAHKEAASSHAGERRTYAMLRLLQLLANHGEGGLEGRLEAAFEEAAAAPWGQLSPQLFAQLGHPRAAVRRQIQSLLCTLAQRSPDALVYPVLVERGAALAKGDMEMAAGLSDIEAELGRGQPKMVGEVQVLIKQLARITVLWEEQCLSTLQELQGDVQRRVATLREEAARTADNQALRPAEKARISAKRYAAVMTPVAVALERCLRGTCGVRPGGRDVLGGSAPTPHEEAFQAGFGEALRAALIQFKRTGSAANPAAAWAPFKHLAAALHDALKRRHVDLAQVAPHLSQLSGTHIPMPGVGRTAVGGEGALQHGGAGAVTVQGILPEVGVLHTKTKPKKLTLLGSDGCTYTYLLKGREDLRLDERIMQFLRSVNNFLESDREGRGMGLCARHYSVTPLGGRAGLIRWVEHTSPLFRLYKAWQERSVAAGASEGRPVPAAAATRPTEHFYSKVIPALKEQGLRRVLSRKDWPLEVLRRVLVELMRESPRTLLARELWVSSASAAVAWQRQNRFSRSLAVMSMVGHVLGIGDRHLDNILLDMRSGEVVHIDYNVCFDKGARLKVPEIVPFRLTQTLQAGLGPTGLEGVFRASCEATARVLRGNRGALLALLEAFVYDPLVEWSQAHQAEHERRGMETVVTLSLFATRVQEMHAPMHARWERLRNTLPRLDAALAAAVAARARARGVEQARADASSGLAGAAQRLQEVRARGGTLVLDLDAARLAQQGAAAEAAAVKAAVAEAARACSGWYERHAHTVASLRGGSAELEAGAEAARLCLTAARMLPVDAAQLRLPGELALRVGTADVEGETLLGARQEALGRAVQALREYAAAVQVLLPADYTTTSLQFHWSQALCQVAAHPTAVVARAALCQVRGAIAGGDKEGTAEGAREEATQVRQVERSRRVVAQLRAAVEAARVEQRARELEHEAEESRRTLEQWVLAPSGGGRNPRGEEERREALRLAGASLLSEWHDTGGMVLAPSRTRLADLGVEDGDEGGAVEDPVGGHGDTGEWGGGAEWCLPELLQLLRGCSLVKEVLAAGGVEWPEDEGGLSMTGGAGNWVETAARAVRIVEDVAGAFESELLPAMLAAVQRPGGAAGMRAAAAAVTQVQAEVARIGEWAERVAEGRHAHAALLATYDSRVAEVEAVQECLAAEAAQGEGSMSWEEAHEVGSRQEAATRHLQALHATWADRAAAEARLAQEQGAVHAAMAAAAAQLHSVIHPVEAAVYSAADQIPTVPPVPEPAQHILRSLGRLLGQLDAPDTQLQSARGLGGLFDSGLEEGLEGALEGALEELEPSEAEAGEGPRGTSSSGGVGRVPPGLEQWRLMITTQLPALATLVTMCAQDPGEEDGGALAEEAGYKMEAGVDTAPHNANEGRPVSQPEGTEEPRPSEEGGDDAESRRGSASCRWGRRTHEMQRYHRLRRELLDTLDGYLRGHVQEVLLRSMGQASLRLLRDCAWGGIGDLRGGGLEGEVGRFAEGIGGSYSGRSDEGRPDEGWRREAGTECLAALRAHCRAVVAQQEARSRGQGEAQSLVRAEGMLRARELDLAQWQWLRGEEAGAGGAPAVAAEALPGGSVPLPRRAELLQRMEGAAEAVVGADEALVEWEARCVSLEGDLQRAAAVGGWAHLLEAHLGQRRQALWTGGERASAAARLCKAVLQFERSREEGPEGQDEGGAHSAGEASGMPSSTARYTAMLERLEAAATMGAAADSAAVEMAAASAGVQAEEAEASTAVAELQNMLESSAEEAAECFAEQEGAVRRLQEALQEGVVAVAADAGLEADAGSMLEEVVALTSEQLEGVQDIRMLAKSALADHRQVTGDLTRLRQQLAPLAEAMAVTTTGDDSTGARDTSGVGRSEAPAGTMNTEQMWTLIEEASTGGPSVPELLHGVQRCMDALAGIAAAAGEFAASVQQQQEEEGIVAAFVQEGGRGAAGGTEAEQPSPLTGEAQAGSSSSGMLAAVVKTALRSARESATSVASGQPPGDENPGVRLEEDVRAGESSMEAPGIGAEEDQDQEEDPDQEVWDWLSAPGSSGSIWSNKGGGEDTSNGKGEGSASVSGASVQQLSDLGSSQTPAELGPTELPARSSVADVGSCVSNQRSGLEQGRAEDGGEGRGPCGEHAVRGNQERGQAVGAGEREQGAVLVATELRTSEGSSTGGGRDAVQAAARADGQDATEGRVGRPDAVTGLAGSGASMAGPGSPQVRRVRSAHAEAVLRRVAAKLAGTDIDGRQRLGVSEQVDHLLRQAVSLDNLCQMFEGWTPWI